MICTQLRQKLSVKKRSSINKSIFYSINESPASPSIFGSIPISSSANPNAVFPPSPKSPISSPMRRLSSFKKREDRDLSLKRPQTSALKGNLFKVCFYRFLANNKTRKFIEIAWLK